MRRYKIFVLGLDGATFDLIHPWVEAGYLPTLRRLMGEGAKGDLSSTIPPITGPAWTTFMTGCNPGKHAIFDWVYRQRASYGLSPVTAQHCAVTPLWNLLSRAGRRVCLINVPMTYPPQPVNGLLISGLPAPSTAVTITYPTDLLAEISDRLGPYRLYPDPGQAYSDSGVRDFLTNLYQTTDNRLQVLDYLRAKEAWDFLMVVFNGTDTVQHAMWKYMDESHPQYDPLKAEQYGSAILDYFQYLDGKLARVVDSLDKETVLIVMSDHGFGPIHQFIHVNNWLLKQGWMYLKSTPMARFKHWLFQAGFTPMGIYNRLMDMGLGAFKREVVRGRGQTLLKKLFLSYDEVDWSRTVAYSMGNVGQIYLNVRGREPQGIVDPGEEYQIIQQAIMRDLAQLRDPLTGQPVIEYIYRSEDVYQGDSINKGADILFLPKNLEYFGFGEYEFGYNQIFEPIVRGISGTHRMNGILIMNGRPVLAGQPITGANLADLAPTILHLMGLSIPAHMDGRVLTDAFEPDLIGPLAARVEGDIGQAPLETDVLSAEEERIIAERFRSLGYVS